MKKINNDNTFGGIRTFLRSPTNLENAKFQVWGIPVDWSVTNRSGTRMGPSAIRDASLLLADGDNQYFDNDPAYEKAVMDCGDFEVVLGNIEKTLKKIEEQTLRILHNPALPIFLGGEHTVTLGILRAMKQKYGKVALIHFDAHMDTWDSNFGEPYGHATFLYNAIEEGLVDPKQTIQIGIRSPIQKEYRNWTLDKGVTVFPAIRFLRNSNKINDFLSDIRNIIPDETPVYMSLDIDAIDPSQAPGTGTPEIAGMETWMILDIIEHFMTLNYNFVGMDLVEVSPPYDVSNITSLAAATFIWQFISGILARNLN